MKRLSFALSALAFATGASAARPLYIEESQVLTTPDAAQYTRFGYEIATDGTQALIAGYRAEGVNQEFSHYMALLYRKVNGVWTFDSEIAHGIHEFDSYTYPVEFAIAGDLAAIGMIGSTHRYERTPTGWVDRGSLGGGPSEDVDIDAGRILFATGDFYWNGYVSEPTAAGAWQRTFLQGQPRGNDDEFWGGPVALGGDIAVLGTPYTYDLEPQEIPVYRRDASGWPLLTKLQVPYDSWRLRDAVAVRGDDIVVDAAGGPFAWRGPNYYSPYTRLQALDSTRRDFDTPGIEAAGNLVLVREMSPDLGVNVIKVFRHDPEAGTYSHVAVLAAKNRVNLGISFDVVGNTVMVGSGVDKVLIFELPAELTTPARRFDDFQSGNAGGWTPSSGSQFAVATQGTNRVYRQSSTAGDARAVLGDSAWINQAIEAEIRPIAFNGADRWVGLATRFVDAQNHYYVTLRSSGSVQLRRMRGGTITTLASAPLTVTANRTYRVRLESINSRHRVYVDGRRVLDADDTTLGNAGSAALVAYRASADYDNVVVSPTPRTTMFANDFVSQYTPGAWSHYGTGQWTLPPTGGWYSQNSVAGDARAWIGTPADDQVVEARLRLNTWAGPGGPGSQERWMGLLARRQSENNYYYLTLRNTNTVSLRKIVNNAVTILGNAPLTITPGNWYTLRLEAVGPSLRAYVNGQLVIQASDPTFTTGASGLATFKAAADFDDFVAYQP